jgi:iron(III)-enterobactin esterase
MVVIRYTIFGDMAHNDLQKIIVEQKKIRSVYLKREVIVDFYTPANFAPYSVSLLLINDGQDLPKMNFAEMLDELLSSGQIISVVCIGIHAGDRMAEYGTAHILDFKKRGKKSLAYQKFLLNELLPIAHTRYRIEKFLTKAIAGFSLGGLSALDTAWNNPKIFSIAGIFSGSLWWRSKDLDDGYNEETDRIMHRKIRESKYHPGLCFYIITGSLDETADRNNNGIIDSIDDALALIEELKNLGYNTDHDIKYINYEDGKHDVASWGKAMPRFLLWGWGKK